MPKAKNTSKKSENAKVPLTIEDQAILRLMEERGNEGYVSSQDFLKIVQDDRSLL